MEGRPEKLLTGGEKMGIRQTEERSTRRENVVTKRGETDKAVGRRGHYRDGGVRRRDDNTWKRAKNY